MTGRQRFEMYRQYPEALAEQVGRVFAAVVGQDDAIKHNVAVAQFIVPFANDHDGAACLYRAVAQTILEVTGRQLDRMEKENTKT